MSQWDKLLDKLKSLSKDMRFSELQKILEGHGYTMYSPKSGSSHYTFRKPGKSPITIPKHEPIKTVYVRMVKAMIESEGSDNEND